MSFREENAEGKDLQKPFLHTGSWYKMGSRQSSVMGSTTQVMRDGSVSVLFCVLIAALGPIQFGFTVRRSLLPFNFQFPISNFFHHHLFHSNFFGFLFGTVWLFFSDARCYRQRSKALTF